MFFSIIIPVHNGEKYLRDCLDSCLEQDFPASEFEIICVDDSSSDGSVAILREYEAKFSNVRVIAFPKNKGVSAARNAGLEQMQGDWCLFLDSDDFLADGCFAKAKALLSGREETTMLCIGRFHFEEKGYSRQECVKKGTYFGCPTERYITNRFIPARLARQFRFQEKVYYGEDEIFSLELALLHPPVLQLEEPLYFYRMHGASAMNLTPKKRLKRLDSVIRSAVYVRKKYGLENPDTMCFFKGRIKIALGEIDHLSFFRRHSYLWRMRALRLVVWRKNDSKGRASLSTFWNNRVGSFKRDMKQVKEEKGAFRSFLFALKKWIRIF